jgi:SAM-dependent methyltransferase
MMNGSRRSAGIIVPKFLELFPELRNVVDFGCGAGIWLNEFKQAGLEILGYDFGIGVNENLIIPNEFFKQANLSIPITVNRHFDLAISLEVAEHIFPEYADCFVSSLVNAADIVLFSAAVPCQGGTEHHNEQWPAYWIEKFSKHSFKYLDILRPLFWHDNRIEWWYRQNIIIFIKDNKIDNKKYYNMENFSGYPLIHPGLYIQIVNEKTNHHDRDIYKLCNKIKSILANNKYIYKSYKITTAMIGKIKKYIGI